MNYCFAESSVFKPINPVAEAVWWACITELKALKPGNVSVYAAGHDMTVDDFAQSADSIANIIATPGLRIGERVLKSVEATQAAVGCNTNLGIILLCAPLAHSALEMPAAMPLRERLANALKQLDSQDSELVFQAIRLAKPAGLGHSERHDVQQTVAAGLLDVMREAAQRDRIAYQYANAFIDVFDIGLTAWQNAITRGLATDWAGVEVYLNFLARFQDTHIRRKLGEAAAISVQREGRHWLQCFKTNHQPEQMVSQLLEFDSSLKQRGINPGTSADLTVATLLTNRLLLAAI